MGMAFKTGIPRGQRFVLVKLCDCANDEGLCYPSQETVAEDTGFGETAVQQHIKWLKENNFIKSARRQRGRERQSDIYRINVALLEKCYAEAAKRKAERRAKMREEPSDFEPSDFEPSDFEPSDFGSKNPQILSHEPSDFGGSLYEEPSVEPSIEPSGLNARAAHTPASHAETEKRAGAAKPNPANVATWKAYAAAYRDRYGVLPAANAKTRGQAANLVRMVGADLAPSLAAYYLTHNGGFFVQCRHDFGLLLKSYQQILTDMQRGEQMTQTRARQTEKTQTAVETHNGALAILQAKGLV